MRWPVWPRAPPASTWPLLQTSRQTSADVTAYALTTREEHLDMTMKQPRLAGRQPSLRELTSDEPDCTIAIQALCHGPLDWRVHGVTGAAARPGREHIALQYGRVLLYLEDRAALEALTGAVQAAHDLCDRVFGEPEDAFTQAERRSRRRLESSRGGR
jgi:hypothetical protein